MKILRHEIIKDQFENLRITLCIVFRGTSFHYMTLMAGVIELLHLYFYFIEKLFERIIVTDVHRYDSLSK